jgi:hypothetical protein
MVTRIADAFDTRNLSSLRDVISQSVERALCQLHQPCSTSLSSTNLREMISSSITFPNNNNNKSLSSCKNGEMDLSGKPYDIEVRVVLKLYHQWRREQQQQQQASIADRTTREKTRLKEQTNSSVSITLTSDLGLSRTIATPKQLAELISPLLEEEIRDNIQWGLSPDVRCQTSGVLSLITLERSQCLRETLGMLPCPHCTSWCKGEKGLWWHQQLHHHQVHEQAIAVAEATSNNPLAIVVYNGFVNDRSSVPTNDVKSNMKGEIIDEFTFDPIECIRGGKLNRLQYLVDYCNIQLATFMDRNGATPLMWAAGGGHMDMVRYLIHHCHCDPMTPQKGKRSFSGRTALHWAARNGKLPVVQYLLTWAVETSSVHYFQKKKQMLEAATLDGTTAFGWACWQRHLDVMKCLHQEGCVLDGVNSFGCSPVLWCSQGSNGDGLAALKWLQVCGCFMYRVNHNGHSVLHKAAQRGQFTVGEWFVQDCIGDVNAASVKGIEDILTLVGPDVEGYCPSDLAGMEGHVGFAKFLAKVEMEICCKVQQVPSYEVPAWTTSCTECDKNEYIWEKYGGLRRMMSCIKLR